MRAHESISYMDCCPCIKVRTIRRCCLIAREDGDFLPEGIEKVCLRLFPNMVSSIPPTYIGLSKNTESALRALRCSEIDELGRVDHRMS